MKFSLISIILIFLSFNGQGQDTLRRVNGKVTETLQEVTVFGVKVKTSAITRSEVQILDLPQSVAVIGQTVIRQQAAYDLPIITRNISGLNFTGNYSGGGSYQFFNARGFDLNDAQSYRWNGVMIWNLGNNYSDNIEQVEFLKGPTSVLYGDVAPGGVMNFTTKKPLAQFKADINLKTGSWGLIRPALDVTGPISKDLSLKYRFNSSFEKAGSFRDQVSSSRFFMAPTISWDISSKLSLTLEAVFKKSAAVDDAGLVSPDGTINGLKQLPPSLYLGEPDRKYLFSDQSYFAMLNYEIGNGWRLKGTGFYGNTSNRPFGIWFNQPDEAGDFERNQYGYDQRSHNSFVSVALYGNFFTGLLKHQVLIGAEHQSTNVRFTNAGELSLLDTNNLFHPFHGRVKVTEPAELPYQPYLSIIQRSGINFQDQLTLKKEKLHLLFGLRLSRTRQGNDYFENQLAGTELEGYRDNIITKNIIIPRFGVVYKNKPWSSLYASYARGYEINAPDIFAKNYLEYASPPATVSQQIEFGYKANLFRDRLGLTLSAFQINKSNPYGYIYLNPENPDYDEYEIYYSGRHRSRGIELDMDGKVSNSIYLTAGAAYTRTRIKDDPGYPDGNSLPNVPQLTGNFWINYEPVDVLRALSVGGGVFYKSKFFSSLQNNPNLQVPGGYTMDLAMGYKWKQLGFQLNVMNLTNRVTYLNPWVFNMFDVKPLRQFILTLSYRII